MSDGDYDTLHGYAETNGKLVAEIEVLRAENEKLKDLLNKGHESLMRENEQLRWANAIKDARLYLLDREPK
jgi:cell shape-determining protein MreC